MSDRSFRTVIALVIKACQNLFWPADTWPAAPDDLPNLLFTLSALCAACVNAVWLLPVCLAEHVSFYAFFGPMK